MTGDSKSGAGGSRARGTSHNPLALLGLAFAAGLVLARVVDWRGYAHPRR